MAGTGVRGTATVALVAALLLIDIGGAHAADRGRVHRVEQSPGRRLFKMPLKAVKPIWTWVNAKPSRQRTSTYRIASLATSIGVVTWQTGSWESAVAIAGPLLAVDIAAKFFLQDQFDQQWHKRWPKPSRSAPMGTRLKKLVAKTAGWRLLNLVYVPAVAAGGALLGGVFSGQEVSLVDAAITGAKIGGYDAMFKFFLFMGNDWGWDVYHHRKQDQMLTKYLSKFLPRDDYHPVPALAPSASPAN